MRRKIAYYVTDSKGCRHYTAEALELINKLSRRAGEIQTVTDLLMRNKVATQEKTYSIKEKAKMLFVRLPGNAAGNDPFPAKPTKEYKEAIKTAHAFYWQTLARKLDMAEVKAAQLVVLDAFARFASKVGV